MDNEQKTALQNKLKSLRRASGLTQAQTAQKLFIARSSWANYETGKRMPTVDMLQKIADLFGVNLDFLLNPSENSGFIPYPAPPELAVTEIGKYMVHDKYLDVSRLPTNEQIFFLRVYNCLCDDSNKKKIRGN